MFLKKKEKKQQTDIKVSDIPNIEPEAVYALEAMGYKTANNLLGKNAEDIFYKYTFNSVAPPDVILLYMLKSAVYFANVKKADPKKLFWWYWKDAEPANALKDEELKQKLREAGYDI